MRPQLPMTWQEWYYFAVAITVMILIMWFVV